MAKNDNLKDFLTDLYEGIASKKPNASRNPQNFRSEIESIETGGSSGATSNITRKKIKLIGTPVPNDGTFVENIYINYNLTNEEIFKIIYEAKLEFNDNFEIPLYPICYNQNTNIAILLQINGDGINLLFINVVTSEVVGSFLIASPDGKENDGIVNFVFNANTVDNFMGIPIGLQNDKLSKIFSSTPFEEEIEDIVKAKIGGEFYEEKKEIIGTAIPNDGAQINRIYFNTSLSPKEIDEIINDANLIYLPNYNVYAFLFDSNTYNAYVILKYGEEHYNITRVNFANQEDFCDYSFNSVWINSDEFVVNNGYIDFPNPITTINNVTGLEIGLQNDKLSRLISSTPFEEKVITKPINGEYLTEKIVVTGNGNIDILSKFKNDKIFVEEVEVNGYVSGVTQHKNNTIPTISIDGENINKETKLIEIESYNEEVTLYESNAEITVIRSNIKAEGLSSENIRCGRNILGYPGTFTEDANATSDDILKNKNAYVKGYKVGGGIETYDGSNNLGNTFETDVTDRIVDGTIKKYNNEVLSFIRPYAFIYCSSLQEVNFPMCSYIGQDAFYDCSSLTSISFPMCSYINHGAFESCTSLQSINFPMCSYIDNYAFQSCKSLQEVNFPMCNYIGDYAFERCTSLQSINFPMCNNIGEYAFCFCVSLQEVNFPMCSYIESTAFYNCRYLQSVSFPACRHIGDSAFRSCTSLESVYLNVSSVPQLDGINAFASTPLSKSTFLGYYGSIYVPTSLYEAFCSATNWATYSQRIVSYDFE